MKIKMKEKLAYGLGDSAANLVWSTITAFLTIYYTDSIGLGAAAVGTMMLVTRTLDGFSDLLMGAVIDKTTTRFGKARPWVLISMPMMALGLILLFNVPSSFGNIGKLIYAYITYIFIAAVAFTASNLSYSTLLSLMTDSQSERTSISAIRMIFANGTGLILAFTTPALVKNMGYGKMSYIYAGLTALFLVVTFLGTKERIKVSEDKKSSNIPLKKSISMLFHNKYFAFATVFFLLSYTANNLCNGAAVYFASYILGDSSYYGLMAAGMVLPVVFGLPLLPRLVKRIGKCKAMLLGFIIQLIGFGFVFFIAEGLPMTILGLVLVGFGRMPVMSNLFAFVADVIDYGEWKTGVRLDGLTNSITSFGMKVGTGLGAAGVGWILAFGSYEANTVQSDSSVLAIKTAFALVPLIITVLNIIIVSFCKLDKEYPEIAKALSEKRG